MPAVPKIRLEKEPQGRLRWLTEDELKKLLEACGKSRNRDLRAAVTVAINTGLRRSELLGLTWDRADLSRGIIRLEVTKSGKRREVPLNAEPYAALVSLGVMRGVSLKELQELLGHSSLAMTMRYAHLAPERLRLAVTRLEGLISSNPASEQINASVNA